MNKKLQRKLRDLPELPGIYIFFDRDYNVLYVGKARSLKKRVRSYFVRANLRSPRIERMRGEIADFKYFITRSEVDALIQECNLIKKYRPQFNIDYKDDKSYPFIKITKEDFPSVSLVRIPPSSVSDASAKKAKNFDGFLFGPYPKVKPVKDAIGKIRSVFPFRSCKKEIREDRIISLCLDYHIGLCAGPCQNKIGRNDYKRLIRGLVLLLKGEKKGLMRDLRSRMNKLSRELKFEEAAKIRNQLLGLEEIVLVGTGSEQKPALAKVLVQLQTALGLPSIPLRIEGFDISNISGNFSTGALAVFHEGVPSKNEYRHFRIKSVEGINDVQMLKEITMRHYNVLISRNEKFPDLILVDGGIAQLNAVCNVLEELQLKIPVISLAKKFEEVFKKENAKIKKIHLHSTSPVLHLLEYIRDEAHRFAIRYHKILRNRETKKSILDEIPGIGEKRKQRLLRYFSSIEEIKKSSVDKLKKLGIPSNIAQQILEET